MHDHMWWKTWCLFWQNFLWSEFRGPDLSPLDFFLWTFLKNIVYKDALRNIAEIKKKIESAIRITDTIMRLTVSSNLLQMASSCLVNEEGHFEY